MKKFLKRGLSLVLALVMVAGLLPVTAFAAVDSSGKPTDLNNTLVLSIYTPEGSFPGEPAMHGSDDYISFNSKFSTTSASGKFKDNATTELKTEILADMVQGTSNGNNTVWGVFSADGLKEKYFKTDASIIQPANEAKIIREIKDKAVKGMSDEEILQEYEIIWYVIKLQHSPGSGWWSRATTEWHIDGIIREKREELISINYYGNGNTEGSAPDGVTNHIAGSDYTVLGSTNMKKKINGVYVDFLGWSAKADGTGDEAGFYQPGEVIKPTQSISLYAMWDTFTQYTATVNTYLDGVLTDASDIHDADRDLYLSTDEEHYYQLTRSSEGVYTVKITGNGKFHLYHKNADGTYTQIGTHQLTIYNQNGSLDVHHYSVTYDANGGEFADGTDTYTVSVAFDSDITAPADPTREGYDFVGWDNLVGTMDEEGMTFTAIWTETVDGYTVTYVVQGETYAAFDVTLNADLEVPASPDLAGWKFLGWEYSETGFVYNDDDEDTTNDFAGFKMPAKDITFTAVLERSSATVSFYDYEDLQASPWKTDVAVEASTAEVNFGETIVFPENNTAIQSAYWTFLGWSTTEGGEVIDTTNIIMDEGVSTTYYAVYEKVAIKLMPAAGSTTVIERNGEIESYNEGDSVSTEAVEVEDGETFDEYIIYGLKTALSKSAFESTWIEVQGDGYVVTTTANGARVGTGTLVEVYDRNGTDDDSDDILVEQFYVVIFGDIDGNSRYSTNDDILLSEEVGSPTWSATATRVYYMFRAANLDGNRRITINDSVLLSEVVGGGAVVDQVTGLLMD